MSNQPRSILVADVSPFGCSLFLLPAIRTLRAAYPKTFIAVATSKGTCELLTATGLADEVIDLGIIKPSSDGGYASAFKRGARLFNRARQSDFELVIDFSPRLETQMLSRFVIGARTITPSRLPHVIEMLLGTKWRGAKQQATSYENVLRQLGIVMSGAQLAIQLPAEEHAQFEQILDKRGSRGGEPIVVLYASNLAGGWPVESFGEMAVRLAHNFGARVIAADEPSDKAFTEAVGALLPQTAIKLSEPRALELAAAIARASLVITDERGLAELAAELGTPVIEISDNSTSQPPSPSKSHRVVAGSSRARVVTDEVYEIACEMLQASRSASLFRR